MKQYKGNKPKDKPEGGGKYVEEYGDAGEVYNFRNENGVNYGYTRPGSINIKRLGAKSEDLDFKGAIVVWFAKHPQYGGQYIVGWYKNATVYKYKQKRRFTRGRNSEDAYNVRAKSADCRLIPETERLFELDNPRPGQNFVWYGHEHLDSEKLEEIFSYVKIPRVFLRKSRLILKNRMSGDTN